MIRKFGIFQGDIGNCNCDIIVNSSNTRLSLGTGVSKRISELCGGNEYQVSLRELLAEAWPDESSDEVYGRLPHGEAILTHAGRASDIFKAIVHVAAVDYEHIAQSGDAPQQHSTNCKIIETCSENLLREVQQFAYQNDLSTISVGIPLMGSSSGKLSPIDSAESICNGIRKFFTDFLQRQGEQSNITEVSIVAYDEDSYQAAYGAMRKSRLIVL